MLGLTIQDAQNRTLSRAIFSQSPDEVERLLHPFPPLDERNEYGQTPLYLAANQPDLLDLMLAAGFEAVIDRKDNFGYTPAAYAGACNNLAALQLLLDADCALSIEDGDDDILDIALEDCWNGEILHVLIDAFADRRRRLCELAFDNLTPAVLRKLNLQNHTVLDEHAYSVRRALKRSGICIPSALEVPKTRTTIYHKEWSSQVHQLDKLYEAGFRDIDGLNQDGWTPLACVHNPGGWAQGSHAFRLWLLKKGAKLTRRLPDCSKANIQDQLAITPWTTPAHISGLKLGHGLASRLWYDMKEQFFVGNQNGAIDAFWDLVHDERRLMATVSARRIFDDCRCACSTSGCTPAITIMKCFWRWLQFHLSHLSLGDPPEPKTSFWQGSLDALQRSLVEKVASVGEKEQVVSVELALELLRLITFEKLQLTHTCCRDGKYYYPPASVPDDGEIDEIQEEERYGIAQLEDLVAELCLEFTKRREPLRTFLDGYWTRRMEEVLAESNSSDEEEIRQIEEFGVRVER